MKPFLFIALGLGLTTAVAGPAEARQDPVSTGLIGNVAVSGYDTVAYLTQGAPLKGSRSFTATYNGAEFFASAANRDAFKANPAKYAPQYGGYCAWAVSQGYTASADPNVWKIVEGKLYLNYNAEVGRKWSRDIPGHIRSANSNWPRVLDK